MKAPLSDSILFAVCRLVDDAQGPTRYPSHNEIDFIVTKFGLGQGDPKTQGLSAGKMKRVRQILNWSLEFKIASGEAFVGLLLSNLRANGGFRPTSPNYVGAEPIEDARRAFLEEGFELHEDGTLQPKVLDSLSGVQLTRALQTYVTRARKGSQDAALLTGTGKDLLEATAAHVLTTINGSYSDKANFPTLLGQAFIATGMKTSAHQQTASETVAEKFEKTLFEAACAVNSLRNKQGTGHGRPWLPSVTDVEAKAALEVMATVASRLLACLP